MTWPRLPSLPFFAPWCIAKLDVSVPKGGENKCALQERHPCQKKYEVTDKEGSHQMLDWTDVSRCRYSSETLNLELSSLEWLQVFFVLT